jgi:hypothetical protein
MDAGYLNREKREETSEKWSKKNAVPKKIYSEILKCQFL